MRVVVDPLIEPGNTSDQILQHLIALGCSYEGANRTYISSNIPPGVEFDGVRKNFITSQVTWEHADPSYEELFPESE